MKNPEKFDSLKAYRICGIKHTGLSDKYCLNITQVRKNQCIYSNLNVEQFVYTASDAFLMGDVFI